MAFKVTDVIQETLSGARPSLFMAHITFPTGIGSGAGGAGAASRFLIKATSLPSATLGIIELPFMGRKIKIAGDRTFEDWETTIVNDERMYLRSAVEKWSDAINGMQSNRTKFLTNNLSEYRTTADVTQISMKGEPIRTYTFHNVWPSTVAAIEVGWETTDTISEFSVTWTYDYFLAKNGIDGIKEGLDTLGTEVGDSLQDLIAQVAQ